MSHIPFGCQLYTLRDIMPNDFVGTLKKVAAMGYEGVEWAGYGGLGAKEIRSVIDDLGIKSLGCHVSLEALQQDIGKEVEFQHTLGTPAISVPWLSEEWRTGEDAVRNLAGIMNELGAKVTGFGFDFCYHNHSFEFQKINGKYMLDWLYELTDPKLVQAQLDTYWVKHGGEDPAVYIKKLSGRVPQVHLKDMAPGEDRAFAEFGEGTLNWDAIIPACHEAGVKAFLVEQDTCARPPLEAIKISIDNARKRGLVG